MAHGGVTFAEALRCRLKLGFMNFGGPQGPDCDDAQGAIRFRDRHSADAIGAGDHFCPHGNGDHDIRLRRGTD